MGSEYAWRLSDVENTILAAEQVGLATIGGQTQFRTPKGTYELYWLDFDSTSKSDDEMWDAFVKRSAQECLERFRHLCETTDFIEEGLQSSFLQKIAKTEDISSFLCFVIYFASEVSYD